MRKAFDLRPLDFNDILGRSFSLFTANFVGYLRWFLIAWLIPVMAIAVLFYFALEPYDWMRSPSADSPSLFEPSRYAAWVWLVKLSSIGFAFSLGAAGIYFMTARIYVGDRPTLGEVMKHVSARMSHISGSAFIHVLALLGLTLVCIGPPVLVWNDNETGMALLLGLVLWGGYTPLMLWYMSTYGLNVASTLLDDAEATESFPRSSHLTKRFRMRLIGVMLTAALVVGVPGIPGILTVPAMIGETLLIENEWPLLGEMLRILWDAVVLPLFFIPFVVFYFDMRCRKESYDLAVMARNFGIAEGEMQRYRFNPHLGYVPKGYKGPVGRRRKPVRRPQPRMPNRPQMQPPVNQPGTPWGPQPFEGAQGGPGQGQWQQPQQAPWQGPQQGPPGPPQSPDFGAPQTGPNPGAPRLPDWNRRGP